MAESLASRRQGRGRHAAGGAFRSIAGTLAPAGSGRAFLVVVTAMVTFLAVESGGLFAISRLNHPDDERYLRAQLADPNFYTVELAVLGSGALAAVPCGYWPGFLLLGGPALGLMQRGMLHQPLRHAARHDAKTGLLNCGGPRPPRPSGTPVVRTSGWR